MGSRLLKGIKKREDWEWDWEIKYHTMMAELSLMKFHLTVHNKPMKQTDTMLNYIGEDFVEFAVKRGAEPHEVSAFLNNLDTDPFFVIEYMDYYHKLKAGEVKHLWWRKAKREVKSVFATFIRRW